MQDSPRNRQELYTALLSTPRNDYLYEAYNIYFLQRKCWFNSVAILVPVGCDVFVSHCVTFNGAHFIIYFHMYYTRFRKSLPEVQRAWVRNNKQTNEVKSKASIYEPKKERKNCIVTFLWSTAPSPIPLISFFVPLFTYWITVTCVAQNSLAIYLLLCQD